VSLIGKPVEHGLAEPGIRKHLWPLGERQVGGHDDGRFLRPFGDDLEEQFGGLCSAKTSAGSSNDLVQPIFVM
jgi:hypothetical protein